MWTISGSPRPSSAQTSREARSRSCGVDQIGQPRHAGDRAGGPSAVRYVTVSRTRRRRRPTRRGSRPAAEGWPITTAGIPSSVDALDPRVGAAQVGEEHPVHPALAPPAAVHLQLLRRVVDDLEQQGAAARGELALDAADQFHEERLHAEHAGPAGTGRGRRRRRGRRVRARAALLGRQPISSAMALIAARVAGETPGRSFSAYDTAPLETPARRAMSAIVGRCLGMRPRLTGSLYLGHPNDRLCHLRFSRRSR